MIVNRKDIKNQRADKIQHQILEIQQRLQQLYQAVDQDTIDIEVINEEFVDVWTGLLVDDVQTLCRTLDTMLAAYKKKLQQEFLAR